MDNIEFSWPDVRRSIFDMAGLASDSSTKCFIDHMGMSSFGYDYLADQYKRAADMIVASKTGGSDSRHPDGLFMPVSYLYRHALELKLKGLLDIIMQCNLHHGDDSDLSGHNLMDIWKKIKTILINQWPTADKKSLNNVEALLCDFHRIDKSGQALRYHVHKSGAEVKKKFPKIVRLELLSEAFNEMYHLLDGCFMHFENMLENINEMRNEYS
ncbi:MAG: hypothetical protein KJ736_08025 [Candidatus Omnitrophica bacterium]|nr:hypothetical protein [Candidatus Omnitrophota bacterium]